MFEGEQFHQFIASRTSQLPLPLSFPHHHQTLIPNFDPYLNNPHQHQPNFLQQLHHQHQSKDHVVEEEREESSNLLSTNSQMERERERSDPWGEDEVVALLKIRSSMEGWFPDFTTWEHVSRKLGEIGYKRSGEKCKEKFEEESCCRHFNNITYTTTNTKNYRILSELEQLCHGGENNPPQKNQNLENPNPNPCPNQNPRPEPTTHQEEMEDASVGKWKKNRKRKRKEKFEMLKGFCEEVVRKMIEQQEEWQRKVIEEMVKRDEEKIAREEAWKKQEMERINKEIELRLNQQSIASDTQSSIIHFLNNLTSPNTNQQDNNNNNNNNNPNPPIQPQTPNSTSHEVSNLESPQNPSPITIQKEPKNPNSPNSQLTIPTCQKTPNERTPEDMGKRWPREEVLALINLRSSFYSFNGDNHNHNHQENTKGPLWERISVGMLEMGYKRSAKRCKEKWENINKYFRKTKDVHKKRPLDSRTCPYFHHLTTLYTQPTPPENHPTPPENHSTAPENLPGDFQVGSSDGAIAKNVVTQVPPFDFEF